MTWKRRLLVFASSLLLAVAPGAARAESPVSTVRLYAIECGHMDVLDMGVFADTGEYDGKSGPLAVTCYLIRHPMGTLLWDTGLSDKLAENKDGGAVGPFKLSVKTPLIDQLKTIGVTPADVTYLAFSHFHFDHTGKPSPRRPGSSTRPSWRGPNRRRRPSASTRARGAPSRPPPPG
jgi:N-acyl homoserine lactone hydrolase